MQLRNKKYTSSASLICSKENDGKPTTQSLQTVHSEDHGPFVPPKLVNIRDVKPALKKHAVDEEIVMKDVVDVERDDGECVHRRDSQPKKALYWDEKVIEEHDLSRGTRMKIDEPKTPFSYMYYYDHDKDDVTKHTGVPSDEDQLAHQDEQVSFDNDILERKLACVAAVREFYRSSSSASSRDQGSVRSDDMEATRKRQHEREFQMHRKLHYNEMQMLRIFREQHPGHPGGLLDGEEDGVDGDHEDGEKHRDCDHEDGEKHRDCDLRYM